MTIFWMWIFYVSASLDWKLSPSCCGESRIGCTLNIWPRHSHKPRSTILSLSFLFFSLLSVWSLPLSILCWHLCCSPSPWTLHLSFQSIFTFTLFLHSPAYHLPFQASCALLSVCDMRVGGGSRDINGRHEGWQNGTVVTEERDGGVQVITDRGSVVPRCPTVSSS